MVAPEPSIVGSDVATDLSKRTDKTSYSIPDDGRAVTIQTDRRRRRREQDRENQSVLSAATNTSLLIEYFENGKSGGSHGRQPSVRVKVTPSAAKRHRIQESADGTSFQISELGNGTKQDSRRPVHTHRIQLATHTGEDRFTLGQNGRPRSYSGDQSTLSSVTSESHIGHGPLNVTVIRESGSPNSNVSSLRDLNGVDYGDRRRRRRTTSRNGTGDSYLDENSKASKNRRSRSVSRESVLHEDAGGKTKLTRQRSQSLSRERITMTQKERIEQAVRDELERVHNPKIRSKTTGHSKAYGGNDSLKPPRVRSRSRNHSRERVVDDIAAEKARARHKAAKIEDDDRALGSNPDVTNNHALIELVQETVKRLIPSIGEMRAQNYSQESKRQTVETMQALNKSTMDEPVVVLSPDAKTPALGMVISERDREVAESDISNSSAPGFGIPPSPQHSEGGQGVSLVGAMPVAEIERVRMPDIPFRSDTPGTYADTRASILTATTGLPYPPSTKMPASGNTPPSETIKPEFPELSELNLGGSELGGAYSVNHEYEGENNFESSINKDFRQPNTPEKKDKGRWRNQKDIDEMPQIREGNDNSASSAGINAVNLFFAEQREREQERAMLSPSHQDNTVEVRHVSVVTNNNFDTRHLDKFATGQQVFDLGANPSLVSTPLLARSAVASVLEPSNVGSNLSFRPQSGPPRFTTTSSALPVLDDPMPDYNHIVDEDDDINTNPSIIQGPISHHQTDNWDLSNNFGDRGLHLELNDGAGQPSGSSRPNSRLASPPAGKDEGYISAANPVGSPGTVTPIPGMRGDVGIGAIDDMLSEAEFYGRRLGSGNSHGMPSPLYDSATGRGIERIESKDIVALMEHLTVRDAQRNARDTEILVTLVRSAAEMRNSFEDIKKALADQQRNIITEVDHNTERSVQKVLQGPRPPPPSTPRRPRNSKAEDDAEDEGRAKRANMFKRALKGLSMRSSTDLERIEDMLCRLLGEVEGLKDGQQFYQQSLAHSVGTLGDLKGASEPQETAANSAGPSRQPSGGKMYDQHHTLISPIQEDTVLDTSPRAARGEGVASDASPNAKAAPSTSVLNSPTKYTEKHTKRESGTSSLFPKISRWSETTASTGLKNFLSRTKNQDGSEGSRSQQDFNFWTTEAAIGNQGELRESPFGSDGQRSEGAGSPISLDIQHPRPRQTYSHQLEQQAQQITAEGGSFIPNTTPNASVSSLGNYPPLCPGGFQNGKLLSPLAQDAYNQHQAQMTQVDPSKDIVHMAHDEEFHDDDNSSTRRHKKHRERDENGEKIRKPKKERTEEEKQRRREKKERRERERELGGGSSTPRKKSRDLLSDGADAPSISGRTLSTASRLNGPRPLSSASNKENSRRHRNSEPRTIDGTY